MEQCEKTEPRLLRASKLKAEHVFVCMQCGRRSWDKQGTHKLLSGWGPTCTHAAVRLPVSALRLDARGLVVGITERAVNAVREAASRAAN